MSQRISSFEQLRVYQAACDLDLAVFVGSKSFPKDERYSLTDQVRRSSRSVGANIAEAWAKRRYRAHFVSKLTDADGELQETKHWLRRALAYGYLDESASGKMMGMCQHVGEMLGRMIQNPDGFT
jgi:four helix bundle protein